MHESVFILFYSYSWKLNSSLKLNAARDLQTVDSSEVTSRVSQYPTHVSGVKKQMVFILQKSFTPPLTTGPCTAHPEPPDSIQTQPAEPQRRPETVPGVTQP